MTRVLISRGFTPLLTGLALAWAWVGAGCKPSPTSTIKDSSAQQGSGPQGTFPGVVLLSLLDDNKKAVGFCSGTFIRDDLVLTVAHCLAGTNFKTIQLSTNSGLLHNSTPVTSNYTTNPKYVDSLPWAQKIGQDVGVVQYTAGTAQDEQVSKVSGGGTSNGAAVTMVGYAETTLKDVTSAGLRYILHSKIASTRSNASNAFTSEPIDVAPAGYNTANTVELAPAGIADDSGGPVFNKDGDIIGLNEGSLNLDSHSLALTGVSGSAAKTFYYVNLHEGDVAAFITQQMGTPKGKAAATPGPSNPGDQQPQQQPQQQQQGNPGTYTDPNTGQTFPVCASAASADSRYPGWGYENNQSCKLP